MRFGGHETFHIREGWLHKGLRLLAEHPDRLADEHAEDWLGVGRNMAKAIRHWLVATGLAVGGGASRAKSPASMELTDIGKLVLKHDSYLLESGTWWALHINLVHAPNHAASWNWFFNHFRVGRFEKPVCLQALTRHLALGTSRSPSTRTLDRDLSCLFSTYARRVPPASDDPEEALECPMIELRLMTHYRDSGAYQLHLGPKRIPAHIVGYAFARAYRNELTGKSRIDVPIRAAASEPNGPGAVFALTAEALFDVLSEISRSSAADLEVVGQASQRAARIAAMPHLEWLSHYYASLEEDRSAA